MGSTEFGKDLFFIIIILICIFSLAICLYVCCTTMRELCKAKYIFKLQRSIGILCLLSYTMTPLLYSIYFIFNFICSLELHSTYDSTIIDYNEINNNCDISSFGAIDSSYLINIIHKIALILSPFGTFTLSLFFIIRLYVTFKGTAYAISLNFERFLISIMVIALLCAETCILFSMTDGISEQYIFIFATLIVIIYGIVMVGVLVLFIQKIYQLAFHGSASLQNLRDFASMDRRTIQDIHIPRVPETRYNDEEIELPPPLSPKNSNRNPRNINLINQMQSNNLNNEIINKTEGIELQPQTSNNLEIKQSYMPNLEIETNECGEIDEIDEINETDESRSSEIEIVGDIRDIEYSNSFVNEPMDFIEEPRLTSVTSIGDTTEVASEIAHDNDANDNNHDNHDITVNSNSMPVTGRVRSITISLNLAQNTVNNILNSGSIAQKLHLIQTVTKVTLLLMVASITTLLIGLITFVRIFINNNQYLGYINECQLCIDSMCNIICLMFQFALFQKQYFKVCGTFDRCLKKYFAHKFGLPLAFINQAYQNDNTDNSL